MFDKLGEWSIIAWAFLMGALLSGLLYSCNGYSYEILEPKSVTLEGEQYDALRDPYIPEENGNWVYGAALQTQITLFGDRNANWRLFYDPRLSFRGSQEQIREGSLNYELGGEILQDRGIRIFRRHESRHKLEYGAGKDRYPLLDSWVIQLKWEFKK